jgi:hypothetical protein
VGRLVKQMGRRKVGQPPAGISKSGLVVPMQRVGGQPSWPACDDRISESSQGRLGVYRKRGAVDVAGTRYSGSDHAAAKPAGNPVRNASLRYHPIASVTPTRLRGRAKPSSCPSGSIMWKYRSPPPWCTNPWEFDCGLVRVG